jgi:hypothetical protein
VEFLPKHWARAAISVGQPTEMATNNAFQPEQNGYDDLEYHVGK